MARHHRPGAARPIGIPQPDAARPANYAGNMAHLTPFSAHDTHLNDTGDSLFKQFCSFYTDFDSQSIRKRHISAATSFRPLQN